ncbi:kelch domain-containing protein 4-like [Ostrinia furnacalis]|uniref:kelch domain-containing protein 4-like n=1 Tax=Ostrinia furnacalis TaxID=93504 RepID=UPI00103DCAE0|nr:kelch domain-containing protein 4-like [Ostrinia furnacalis]
MLPGADSLIIYGGFSRVKEGRTERTHTHTELFRLAPKSGGGGYTWRSLTGGPLAPPARAGQAAAVNAHSGRAYVFGGVSDVEETEEELRGEMSDELLMLDLESGKWHSVTLRTEKQAASASSSQDQGAETVEETKEIVTVVTDEVFTMKLGGAPAPTNAADDVTVAVKTKTGPSARMSAMMAVQRSTLYLYGGVLEKDDKQFYLGDMYSLDLHKLNEWKTIIEQPSLPDWLGSDSEEYETDSEEDSEDNDESDDE